MPPVISYCVREAGLTPDEAYRTFNMGVGMMVAVDPADVEKTLRAFEAAGETCFVIGECKAGEKGVDLC